jgi:hypothetical protein
MIRRDAADATWYHICTMANLAAPYRVAVNRRGKSPKPWQWQISREGQPLPVKRSATSYSSRVQAKQEATRVLARLKRLAI